MTAVVRRLADLAADLRSAPGPVRIVGIDGCGGAGKTTFAARLSRALDDAPVVHTDDFASHEEPIEWWPRMLAQVIEPLLHNRTASYRPYDWVSRSLSPLTVAIDPAPVVIIEGVGATRSAWRDRLALRIWVETSRALRLARGLERDGEAMSDFWVWWMAAEERYVETDQPMRYADLVVDGSPDPLDPATRHEPEAEFVALDLSARQ